jgi:hypothetical protein
MSGPRIHIPQEQGGTFITPAIGFPFRRLLLLAGLRCRYSNPPPHGVSRNSASQCLNTSVRTSQETYYISATETNRLMLFGETVSVYCENHMLHTNTVCTSQETHYVSDTEINLLMLFGETVAVYCVRAMRNTQIQFVPHRKHITSPLQRPTG